MRIRSTPLRTPAAVLTLIAAGLMITIELDGGLDGSRVSGWITVASWTFGLSIWGLAVIGVLALRRRF